MPAAAGETNLLTVFADLHYFLSPPGYKPSHHRFDKASYVYLYQNVNQGRIEVANNAGTPDQDAFTGSLDAVQISYNYKQPTLLSITVDQTISSSAAESQVPQWQLPSYDQKNETKYLYNLHTVDIYFWIIDDALQFLNSAKRLVAADRIQTLNAPVEQVAARDAVSPVVQKLEYAAITTPYESKHDSVSSATSFQPTPQTPASAGPMQSATSAAQSPIGTSAPETSPATQQPAADFAPIPYNPAAPAAPEPIKTREKTPPPPDDGTGIGVMGAPSGAPGAPTAQYTPSYLQQQQPQSYFPGQPQRQATLPGPPAGQPPLPGPPSQQSSFSGPSQPQGSFPPPPPPQTITSSSPPVAAGAGPYQNPTSPQAFPSPPQQQLQPTPPIGGYSTYTYSNPTAVPGAYSPAGGQVQNPYDIHSQVYRPTEGEASAHGHGVAPAAAGQPQGGMQQKAGKLEKGVNNFFKKLDKKW